MPPSRKFEADEHRYSFGHMFAGRGAAVRASKLLW